jgi:hypothetical protein
LPHGGGHVEFFTGVVGAVGGPQDIDFVTGPVCPVVKKVIEKERQHPGQRVPGREVHEACLQLQQAIQAEGHGFDQAPRDLADSAYIHAGERIGGAEDLFAGNMRPPQLQADQHQEHRKGIKHCIH